MGKNYFLKKLLFIVLFVIPTMIFSQSVVINEVVTDPQQDWSANGFNGTPGAGTVSNVDEYLELYIKVSGLDLTGWTIELLDGTDVTGDLTSSGAFDVSNYTSSGSGTFLSTEVGDYLVLGNVDGSGAMNNSITINLKDSGGTIIDTVTLGGGAGEAPNGNASSTANEAVIRTLNGNDSNIDSSDFTQGTASMGASNSSTINWLGKTDNDWSTSSNWEGNSVPGSGADVFIVNGLTNYPTASSAITVNTANISSGASLIAESTFSGSVTYNRSLGTSNWYLISSPIVGQDEDDFVTASSLQQNLPNVALGSYTTASDTWSYYQDGTPSANTLTSGTGYTVNLAGASGDISFTGTLLTSDLTPIDLTTTGNGFNLIGNPYPSYINSATMLTTSSSSLLSETIWLWDQSANAGAGAYTTMVTADAFQIAPGQGFFVQSDGATGTLAINESFQSHQSTDTFLRSANTRPEVHLNLTDGTNEMLSKIYYIDGTTTSFDNGFDGPVFGGSGSNGFNIYTHLVANSDGTNYAIQSLPEDDIENVVIPIGINATSGTEISISVNAQNLPSGINIYLEDKENNSFTRLDEIGAKYTVTLSNTLDGIGRFFLHASSSALSVTPTDELKNISMYTSSKNNLRIVGIQEGSVKVKAYNILGKQVLNTSFQANGVNDVTLPNLRVGIYIIQLETETGKLNRKVIIE